MIIHSSSTSRWEYSQGQNQVPGKLEEIFMNSKALSFIALLAIVLVLGGCGKTTEEPITSEEALAIGKDAYVYGFPMVMNFKTIYNYVLDTDSPEYKGPFNQIKCEARLFSPQDKAVVTPNSDTPYCMYWMDLRSEPLVLSVPKMESERFYHFQFIDLYTHNFAYVGTLATGNEAGKFLIAGPDWHGQKPADIREIIRSETDYVFHVVRTQLLGPSDLENVQSIQESYELQPLSTFLGTEPPPPAKLPDFPTWNEGAQFDERFFSYLDFMMSLLKKPGAGEEATWDDLARLGIGTGGTFDFAALPEDIQEALKAGVREGRGEIEKFATENSKDPLSSAKIFGTREFLTNSAKTNYGLGSPDLLRSVAGQLGLYGNSGAEAIYPTYFADADGQPLDASTQKYSLTFAEGMLPPVKAFWSLSMYDGKTQLFIENSLDRYLLNSTMMDQFQLEPDGSMVFTFSKQSPGKELEGNWLPAPDGPFYLVMRLYGPEAEALDGRWQPPKLVRSN
jgi:hypothetical protein